MKMKKIEKKALFSASILGLTSFFWGLAFVFQSIGLEYIGPNTFNAFRFLLASIFLLFVFIIIKGKYLFKINIKKDIKIKTSIKGGVYIGGILFLAGMTQQTGLLYTSVGKAGFISVLYIIIVPLINFFLGRKIEKKIIFCVLLSLLGLYFLTMQGEFKLEAGDLLILLSAFLYSVHIITVDKYANEGDSLVITISQFFVAGIISLIIALIFEIPNLRDILLAYKAILYTGIISCGLGYTFQVIGQKELDPLIASLIMSLESVFAAICAYIILGQKMSVEEIIGGIFVFIAVILAQVPIFDKIKSNVSKKIPKNKFNKKR